MLKTVHASLQTGFSADLGLNSNARASRALALCDEAVHSLADLLDDLLRIGEARRPDGATSPFSERPNTDHERQTLPLSDPPSRRGPVRTAGMRSGDARQVCPGPESDYESDSSEADSTTHSDCGSELGSDSDSDLDSGYASAQDDSTSECDRYNELITAYEREGPTLANRGDAAKRMIATETKKWSQYVRMLSAIYDGTNPRTLDSV
jgi:hypothetical protein